MINDSMSSACSIRSTSDLIYVWGRRTPPPNHCNLLEQAWIIWKPTLIKPIFEGHRGQSSKHRYGNVSLLFDLNNLKFSTFLQNFDLIRLQILPPYGPLGNILLHLGYVVVGLGIGYTSERHGCTLPELITFSLSIIIFSLSRTTVESRSLM
jgi:hypothetical protein